LGVFIGGADDGGIDTGALCVIGIRIPEDTGITIPMGILGK